MLLNCKCPDMRAPVRARLTPLLCLLATLAAAQPTPDDARKWHASGRVVNAVTGTPIAKAAVTLAPTAGDLLTALTNQEGAFEFTGETPGRYRLTAERSGYLKGEYGSRRPRASGTPIQLDPGRRLTKLELRLTPPSAISGRVFDDNGEPIARASLHILTQTFVRGRRQWLPAAIANTNDRGEYRAFDLDPRKYIVKVQVTPPPSFGVDPPPKSAEIETAFGSLFYPSGDDLAQAQILDLLPGAELPGIDFTLRKVRVFRVTGRVEVPAGLPPGRGALFVSPAGTLSGTSHPVRPDGAFQLTGLQPGTYSLTARIGEGSTQAVARETLIVSDRDIKGLVLNPSSGYAITGRVSFPEGQPKEPGDRGVALIEQQGHTFPFLVDRLKPDSTFSIPGVPPGRYQIEAVQFPKMSYVKSATLGAADILDKEFEITGPANLAITVAFDSSTITGTASLNDEPAPGATVVLIPSGPRRAIHTYFKTVITDTTGRFELEGVPPGDYTLLAFDNPEPGAWFDPDFLKPHESKATKITATPSGTHTATLKVIELK